MKILKLLSVTLLLLGVILVVGQFTTSFEKARSFWMIGLGCISFAIGLGLSIFCFYNLTKPPASLASEEKLNDIAFRIFRVNPGSREAWNLRNQISTDPSIPVKLKEEFLDHANLSVEEFRSNVVI